MILAAILSRLGIEAVDDLGFDVASSHDEPRGLLWAAIIKAEPGGPVTACIVR